MSDALLEAAKEFNKLPDRKKWEQWKAYKGLFVCPYCRTPNTPERCSPFDGTTLHCGNCNEELSRRTGGGQNNPFGWILETEAETTEDQTVTQSQAATIAALLSQVDKWSGWFIHTADLLGVAPTQAAVAAKIAEQEKTVKRLTGEVKRLRHIFEVIDVSYSGGPSTRAEHMLVVFNLVQKALSNSAGGEGE